MCKCANAKMCKYEICKLMFVGVSSLRHIKFIRRPNPSPDSYRDTLIHFIWLGMPLNFATLRSGTSFSLRIRKKRRSWASLNFSFSFFSLLYEWSEIGPRTERSVVEGPEWFDALSWLNLWLLFCNILSKRGRFDEHYNFFIYRSEDASTNTNVQISMANNYALFLLYLSFNTE